MQIKINGFAFEVQEKMTILEVATANGYRIPTLCHLKLEDMCYENKPASCRVCMVEVVQNGNARLVSACDTLISDNMEINIDSNRALATRRNNLELILSNHPMTCLTCSRNTNCDLQKLAFEMNIDTIKYQGKQNDFGIDTTSKSIVKDLDKCILCRRCETICRDVQTVDVYSAINRGFETVIAPAFNKELRDTTCTFCGQCLSVCPCAALTEKSSIEAIEKELANPEKVVIVQTAPAVRVALGEEFGMPVGITTGKMVSALRRIGFDRVFDTNFAADLTIMEEANEVIERLNGKGKLPILTSCCPAWINFIEHQFPELIDIPSTCKSPHEMFGAIVKTYYAQKEKIDPANIVVVSIMPCVAKKYEAERQELASDDMQDVDYVLTTRELARMIKSFGINYEKLQDSDFDNPLGSSSGAAVIFGTTGGVLEAALRTASAWVDGEPEQPLEIKMIRGSQGIKTGTVTVGGKELRVAATHGLGNARTLLEQISNKEDHYDVIEIMACPGGCIAGGGQPYHHGDRTIIDGRREAIYSIDQDSEVRASHLNPDIKRLYDEFLEKPGSHLAHKLLHTHYVKKDSVR